MVNDIIRKIMKYEWVLFYLITLLNLLPAIQVDFFPSLDGPAHLYNANLIHELIFSNSAVLNEFYVFNSEIVPNWGGHFILAFLYSFFPGVWVNKLFIGICLLLLPVSFRFCVKKINKDAVFTTYLIVPFTYTFMFCLGFYNFYIGLIVLFFTLGILISYRENKFKISSLIMLFFLINVSYFSHLFVFLSLGMYMFFSCSLELIHAFFEKKNMTDLLKKIGGLFFVSIIPLWLSINYFAHSEGNSKSYLLKTELFQWITNCRSIICYSVEDDVFYSTCIFLIIMFLLSVGLYLKGEETKIIPHGKLSFVKSFFLMFTIHDSFIFIAGAFLVLYFKLPDSDLSAGFISVRLNLMMFLFFIIWISRFNYPKWISVIGLTVILSSNFKLLKGHSSVFENLSNEITEIMEIEPMIKENSIVLPLNYSNNWLTHHNSNYLGVEKPVVILDNYECNNSYFPLSWNCDANMLKLARGGKNKFDEILNNIEKETLNRVNYIFIQNTKEFPDSLRTKILENFSLIKATENYALYEKI